ncbi:alpha/beta fold hydrolase [Microbacterium sp. H1-D42]|uniref:alpha/beta fold hydrolase n=1 Tax=Microbacterium sp. H1-D42 TaxID=2925844 RepID=UPI001F534BFC|nr:alpha/beta fold hydrolase [Microbacterium sp. H1-D42]UNK71313.1 alpha/beta hydrolase [Microbacterium sp. H1-D42]
MTSGSVGERMLSATLLGVARDTRGVRRLRRPATASAPAFELTYVRTGPSSARPPAVVIPGGPGLGSVLPYRTLRAIAARRGIELIMVEHRGVGLSRTDLSGADLPPSAMRVIDVVDDIAAVLDHEGIPRAHIVGSSYGSYLAAGFGVRHPERVAGMLLDSALQSADELGLERTVIRGLLWEAPTESAALVREAAAAGVEQRVLLDVSRAAYELGGDRLLVPLLRRRLRVGRHLIWKAIEAYATRDAPGARIPGIYEFDLAGVIGFRELGYSAVADGLPLDPALTYAPLRDRFPPFAGEPFELSATVRAFTWPLVLLTGSRDLRTPPAIAARIAAASQHAVTVCIENGHSALDTHAVALLNALEWLIDGRQELLPAIAEKLSALPRRGAAGRTVSLLDAWSRRAHTR